MKSVDHCIETGLMKSPVSEYFETAADEYITIEIGILEMNFPPLRICDNPPNI